MFNNLKNFIKFKSISKYVKAKNFELALDVLNKLIEDDFMPEQTYLERGIICYNLYLQEEAYSDFTYVITHYGNVKAYYYRMKLNFELSNYSESILDANALLSDNSNCAEYFKFKFLSYVFLDEISAASDCLGKFFHNKYKSIQFVLKIMSDYVAENEYTKGLKLSDVIEYVDPDNPLKVFNEAKIYGLIGNAEKENELLNNLNKIFPKYFISHFKFKDMFETKDLLEICFLLELQIFDKENYFEYPMTILKGYRAYIEGRIIESKEAFEQAVKINPEKPEAYVLLAQTLQLLSGYDDNNYKLEAEKNYKIAMQIYQNENLNLKSEDMKRQIRHLNSNLSIH